MDGREMVTQYDLQQAVLHERELREAHRLETQRAIELYQEEVARRLDVLNHAHQNAMENWAQSLPREMFEAYREEQQKRTEELKSTTIAIQARQDSRMEEVRLAINTIQTRSATWMVILGVFMGGVSVVGSVLAIAVSVALRLLVP